MIIDRSIIHAKSFDQYTSTEGTLYVFDTVEPNSDSEFAFDYNDPEALFENCKCAIRVKKHELALNRLHMVHDEVVLPVKGVGRYNADPDKFIAVPNTIKWSLFNDAGKYAQSDIAYQEIYRKSEHLFVSGNRSSASFHVAADWPQIPNLDDEFVEYDLGMPVEVTDVVHVCSTDYRYAPDDIEVQYHDGSTWQTVKAFAFAEYANGETIPLDTPITAQLWRYVIKNTPNKSLRSCGLKFLTGTIPAGNPTATDPKWFVYVPHEFNVGLVNEGPREYPIIYGSASGPDKISGLILSAVSLKPGEDVRAMNLKFDFQILGALS